MSVRPETLENREQGLTGGSKPPRKREEAAAELEALRARIATAKATDRPKDSLPHCSDCFRRGWRSAIAAIEGEFGTT